MEEPKKDATKIRRSKQDQVTQAVLNYLQKRNYPVPAITPSEMRSEEIQLDMNVDSEIGRPNSIMYTCYTSDPSLIDMSYSKFVSWVKELNKNREFDDLTHIIAPLFCHMYLELTQRGHIEEASNFLKVSLSTVEKYKYDNTILRLINTISNDTPDVHEMKKRFRSNKYVVVLESKSVEILKKFLADSCHTVMLQIFQTYFDICDGDRDLENAKTDEKEWRVSIMNGHDDPTTGLLKKLQEVSVGIKNSGNLLFLVRLNNVKDDVTCGLINRNAGIAAYCYNSSIFIRSLITLQQLSADGEFGRDIDATNVKIEGDNSPLKSLNDIVLREHTDRIYDLSYISSINHLVSASQDKTLRLFNLNDFTQRYAYKGHEHPVYCVAASAGGDYILSGSYDHTARLWSTDNGSTIRVYVGHTQQVTSVDFHSNDLYVCTGSADKNIRMWTIKDANPVRLFLGSKGIVYSVAFSANGKYLASSADDKRLRIWDLVAGKQLCEIKVNAEPIMKIAWSESNKLLCTGTVNGLIRTWDVDSLFRTTPENNQYPPRCSAMLNSKLLDVEYARETFGCFTIKPSVPCWIA